MLDPLPSFQKNLIPPQSTIIIGLSGGPDSIYLAHHLSRLQSELHLTLIAAHLDHEWQVSSKNAVKICQDFCNNAGIPLIVKKLSELKFDPKWNGSQEEIGRKMRRHFFNEVAQTYQAQAIALAHHRQDQQETFFIRLIRGSSLTGLIGMKPHENLYIRPLLHCNKADILAYLHEHEIPYYIDPTNEHDTYLRNRIRNHVIPALQKTDARFEKNLEHSMEHLIVVEDFVEQECSQVLKKIKTTQGVDLQAFLQLHTVLQQRILLKLSIEQQISFCPTQKFFKEIMRFLEKSSAKEHIIQENLAIQKGKKYFLYTKIKKNDKTL